MEKKQYMNEREKKDKERKRVLSAKKTTAVQRDQRALSGNEFDNRALRGKKETNGRKG